METEHVHGEISRIQQLITDEEQKRIRYKVNSHCVAISNIAF